ncbi:hypothetical protein Dsin_021314 [Dipteronia sinensis]|uniref:RRM domain-containing protein n=1 Tax=Dipteronia sinensis TaxID=43782 RepID=A0AAD9ZZJ1_9ROSI|nr:hypothetical protein Dsin_021314 [Dipteronia sinensis]
MREKASERSYGSHGYGEKRDFRDVMFSIFIDNLNPMVDLLGLWGIFKPFGNVRDAYLSTKFSSRRSRFAFIRFGSSEEAIKVVEKTNRMLMNGWPIVSKVAAIGWKRRRKIGKDEGLVSESGKKRATIETYDEVLKGNQRRTRFLEERKENQVLTLSWSSYQIEKE